MNKVTLAGLSIEGVMIDAAGRHFGIADHIHRERLCGGQRCVSRSLQNFGKAAHGEDAGRGDAQSCEESGFVEPRGAFGSDSDRILVGNRFSCGVEFG